MSEILVRSVETFGALSYILCNIESCPDKLFKAKCVYRTKKLIIIN